MNISRTHGRGFPAPASFARSARAIKNDAAGARVNVSKSKAGSFGDNEDGATPMKPIAGIYWAIYTDQQGDAIFHPNFTEETEAGEWPGGAPGAHIPARGPARERGAEQLPHKRVSQRRHVPKPGAEGQPANSLRLCHLASFPAPLFLSIV